jgi:hypothetical protein
MNVIRFPARNAAAIFVREMPGDGWLVLARDHGWIHGDYTSAVEDASWLANNFGLPVRLIPMTRQ